MDLHKSTVNVFIPGDFTKVQYIKFDATIDMCIKLGPGCYLGKMDIKSTFRLVPVQPTDWHLLGMHHLDRFYFDKCLPFGLASSCQIFEKVSMTVEAIVQHGLKANQDVKHYLDNFLAGGKFQDTCNEVVLHIIEMCQAVGIPISQEKTVWAIQWIHFLGLDLDMLRQMIHIPDHKVCKLLKKLLHVLGSKNVKVKTLQSLASSLNFYCQAKPGGCTFICRIYDAMHSLPQHKHVLVTAELKLDLQMWIQLLKESSQGTPFLDTDVMYSDALDFATDASLSGELGWGCVFGMLWIYGQWPTDFIQECNLSIAWAELLALVVGVIKWSRFFRSRRIVIKCDNQSIVAMVNQQMSKCIRCMRLLRMLVLDQLKGNCKLRATYIAMKENKLTDALSQLQITKFKNLHPEAADLPSEPLSSLFPLSTTTWRN